MGETKTALITGASTGIGLATAKRLSRSGFTVFGTSRRAASPVGDGIRFPSIGAEGHVVRMLTLDVRDVASVRDCVEAVMREAGRIDLLVNNAGVALFGAIEETNIDEAEALFDTNLFGVMRVTSAVLPIMREQGRGRIVTIGSASGFLPFPFEGVYCASKHALRGYSETLDHEVRQFGIRAALIEPGFFRTEIAGNATTVSRTLDAYAMDRERIAGLLKRGIAEGADPDIVAQVVLTCAEAKRPSLRYAVGRDASRLSLIRRFLPESWFDAGLRRKFGLE